ncbi:unnamed protein product [Strongylus vulgaris]|uniref:Uncharacterized protein n=1 Tax=Strongylus vulgaris TaxID=40348 RepID=A0A3P7JQG4_STRVU|nr:unnamed protein product [Strongylus vulgaris]
MKKEHRRWTWESPNGTDSCGDRPHSHQPTGGGRGKHPTVRLMRRSTTFPPSEGGAYWTSQLYHPSAVVQITASFLQKCDSGESGKEDLSPCWRKKRSPI